ncbi:uncharacterized protein PODANS_1_4820 [Podospora anserina S mat+]|uniref:Podospora anserina S mat+ genomic DNA chromosome 1, supercontig 1 n=1 Tax=Podospora anserina (strain S / ATCC MYA-4624 / DSM 980 / FGSC 10383) TaxID=515849 RepID=B2AAQ4_PODAN|nr:uncharacterized protein PODANS_1_4820 [Podospora anserina S mat+]CAP60166.1 unnamed protein product [Podospora anserina S mat+]CDP22807.1 Putative protein of unknown function [Podospora anserina S mat+]
MAAVDPNDSPHAGPPATSVILAIMIAILILGCVFVAQRSSTLEVIRETITERIRGGRAGVGEETLQSMPVVKYNEALIDELESPGRAKSVSVWTRTRLRFWSWAQKKKDRAATPSTEHSDGALESGTLRPEKKRSSTRSHSCAICTEDFVEGGDVRKLSCGHIFHPSCVDPWLLQFAVTCPLCRVDLQAKTAVNAVTRPQRALQRDTSRVE